MSPLGRLSESSAGTLQLCSFRFLRIMAEQSLPSLVTRQRQWARALNDYRQFIDQCELRRVDQLKGHELSRIRRIEGLQSESKEHLRSSIQ